MQCVLRLFTLTDILQKCKWPKAIISAKCLPISGSILKESSLDTYIMHDTAVYFTLTEIWKKYKWHKAIISANSLPICSSILKDKLSLETYIMLDAAVHFDRNLADMQVT